MHSSIRFLYTLRSDYQLIMEIQDEASTFSEGRIDTNVAIHLQGHLLTDRQSKTIALCKVFHLCKGFE